MGSHKNVHVILSGMSAEDQLTDNLATFNHFEPLSPAENAAVESVANELHRRIKIGCTGCRYCMPCPMGVDIPDNFSIWNKLGMFGQKDAIKAQWTTCFPDSEKALHCVRCGKCEAVCPQKLPIRDSLAQLQKELDALYLLVIAARCHLPQRGSFKAPSLRGCRRRRLGEFHNKKTVTRFSCNGLFYAVLTTAG